MSRKKEQILLPPENSISFRVTVLFMSILCICACCSFVHTQFGLTALYVWGTVLGAYVSNFYRKEKNPWIAWIVVLGTLAITVNCAYEILTSFENGPLGLLTPIVHQIAGVLTLVSFELRSRRDLKTQAVMALVLLCISAPAYRGLSFGLCALAYLCLGTLTLYFDNRSFTLLTTVDASETDAPQVINGETTKPPKKLLLQDLGLLTCLPICGLLAFFLMPRSDYSLDLINALSKKYLESAFKSPQQLPEKSILRGPHFTDPVKTKLPAPPPQKSVEEKPKNKNIKEIKSKSKEGEKEKNTKADSNKKTIKTKGKEGKNNSTQASKSKPKSGLAKKPANPNDKSGKNKQSDSPNSAAPKTSNADKKISEGKNKNSQNSTLNKSNSLDTRAAIGKSNQLLFTVTSTRTTYYRQNCFDYFDGGIWSDSTEPNISTFLHPQKGLYDLSHYPYLELPKGFSSVAFVQEYSFANQFDSLMLSGGIPQQLDYSGATINVDPLRRITADQNLSKGTKYKIYAQLPLYNSKQIRQLPSLAAASSDNISSNYLQVPEDEDQAVLALAKHLKISQDNSFYQCEQIASFLKTTYIYDTEKPTFVEGENTLDNFLLKRKRGDCKDFATAFTILCRLEGIPARCISGYAPGKVNFISGQREVYEADAHVWSEVYIPGYDWVPFDATPKGTMPEKIEETHYSLSALSKKLGNNQISNKQMLKKSLSILGILVAITFLIMATFLIGRSLLRWYKHKKNRHPASHLYAKIIKRLTANKMIKLASETPEEFVARLNKQFESEVVSQPKEFTGTLTNFFDVYAAVYFGNQSRMSELENLGKEVEQQLSRRR